MDRERPSPGLRLGRQLALGEALEDSVVGGAIEHARRERAVGSDAVGPGEVQLGALPLPVGQARHDEPTVRRRDRAGLPVRPLDRVDRQKRVPAEEEQPVLRLLDQDPVGVGRQEMPARRGGASFRPIARGAAEDFLAPRRVPERRQQEDRQQDPGVAFDPAGDGVDRMHEARSPEGREDYPAESGKQPEPEDSGPPLELPGLA